MKNDIQDRHSMWGAILICFFFRFQAPPSSSLGRPNWTDGLFIEAREPMGEPLPMCLFHRGDGIWSCAKADQQRET